MKNYLGSMIIAILALGLFGCSGSVSLSTNTNTAKPSNSNAVTNSNTNSAVPSKKEEAPKTALKNEKKPEGKAKTANTKISVPDNWIYVYDETKGYGFSVPEGTTGGSETQEGVDTFVATTPDPNDIGVVVIAFKDKTMSKDNLLDVAVKFLEEMGEKVQPGDLKAESDNYSLAEATSTASDGKKSKFKILVGTDVTDNYVMIVGTDEAKFAANEATIDEIWGSFEMWSDSNK